MKIFNFFYNIIFIVGLLILVTECQKPGNCPKYEIIIQSCQEDCSTDYNCSGSKKCVRNEKYFYHKLYLLKSIIWFFSVNIVVAGSLVKTRFLIEKLAIFKFQLLLIIFQNYLLKILNIINYKYI